MVNNENWWHHDVTCMYVNKSKEGLNVSLNKLLYLVYAISHASFNSFDILGF